MNNKLKIWVDALKSGKYKQIKGRLRVGKNGFSAVGLLLHLQEFGHWKMLGKRGYAFVISDKIFTDDYPREVLASHLKTKSHLFDRVETMNDDGKTFKQIADVIVKLHEDITFTRIHNLVEIYKSLE